MNETELLFAEVLNCDRTSLYLNKGLRLEKDKSALIAAALKRRLLGEPIQYILGQTEFMDLEFKVSPDVLIPRPETELLVEAAIKQVTKSPPKADPPTAEQGREIRSINILDIGTGSGCIAVSLAKLLPAGITLTATDISAQALQVARQNASLNNVSAWVSFIQSDLFAAYNLTPNTYDLIVSNPPYIATSDIDNLQPEIGYEPRIALDGGSDGLSIYRRIIPGAKGYLKEGGSLILEMGYNQRGRIENIFQKSGNF